ncbi:MAG: cytochrome c biogenesis protein ResB [Acidobacteria bacterium]|nr:cytochrome c biogenesis protein ResB [Acidobacteriota bacterium]
MSAIEETIGNDAPAKSRTMAGESVVTRFMRLLCSVRFGVLMLVLLALASLIGMLIMQENVSGFANYYATLTPAQQLVYGKLDLFDIYHSWYFNAILAVLSLNIILATIDRLPKTLAQVKPNFVVPARWLKRQQPNISLDMEGEKELVTDQITAALKSSGFKNPVVTEKDSQTVVFAEKGKWNRFSYVAVHIALLTIFTGGFLTAQLGSTGSMPLVPGQTTNRMFETTFDLDQMNEITKVVPFEITCTDIQQKLIRKEDSISAGNTIDWLTYFKIKDETGTTSAFVQMNRPFDYRGYRFFQASFAPIGRARNITVRVTPASGGKASDVIIPRNGEKTLADGTKIKFAEFRGDFKIGKEDLNADTSNYPNPGAILQVAAPDGKTQTAYAFGPQMGDIPVAKNPVLGYTYKLVDFEKVSEQHILSVQRDPGSNVVYVGFALLFLTLVAVFSFSHQRIWAVIEGSADNEFRVLFGGNTNRNQNGFSEKFQALIKKVREPKIGEQNL